MKTITVLILTICMHLSVIAQNYLSGTIADKNNEPLCYANIINLETLEGVVSDSSGHYILAYKNLSDQVKISYLGYDAVESTVKELLQKPDIKLILNSEVIEEVVVMQKTPKFKTKVIGDIPNTFAPCQSIGKSNQKATLIEYERSLFGAKVSEVHFAIRHSEGCKCQIRIRFLKVLPNGMPGKDLLNQNLIVRFKNEEDNEKYAIDVSDYNIYLPEKGVFVVFEWININNCEQYSPYLISYYPDSKVLSYYNYMDKGWELSRSNTIKVGLKVSCKK